MLCYRITPSTHSPPIHFHLHENSLIGYHKARQTDPMNHVRIALRTVSRRAAAEESRNLDEQIGKHRQRHERDVLTNNALHVNSGMAERLGVLGKELLELLPMNLPLLKSHRSRHFRWASVSSLTFLVERHTSRNDAHCPRNRD